VGALIILIYPVHAATLSSDETLLLTLRGHPEHGPWPDAVGPQERHGVYRITGMKVHLATHGSFDPSGDVMIVYPGKLSSS
jgi:hypothetical protein